jgi:hypothetical protein
MAIRYWPSDFSKAAQGGCPACSGVQEDVVSGDLTRSEMTAKSSQQEAEGQDAAGSAPLDAAP